MQPNRETKKTTLPISKLEIEYYSYITGGENREWVNIISQSETANYKVISEAQDYIFNTLIISFDNSSEKVSERLLKLSKRDFKFVDLLLADVIKDEDFLETEKN